VLEGAFRIRGRADRVVFEHDRHRLELGNALIGEDLPLASLDVDLDEIGLREQRKHVAARHLAALGGQQRSSLQERERIAYPGLELSQGIIRGSRDPREVKAALELGGPVRRCGARLDRSPALLEAVCLDAAPQRNKIPRIGLQRNDRRVGKQSAHEHAEEAHVPPEVEDADRPLDCRERAPDRSGGLVHSEAEDLLEYPHV